MGVALRAVCSILQCALHCAALSCDCNGYHPLYPIHPFSPLCMAMCRFNSNWEALGAGTRRVCVCVGFADRLTFTVSINA